jgi:hypothetical protein
MSTITASEALIGQADGGWGLWNGVNYSGTFIPSVWSSKLNVKFYASTTFGDVSNTNWEGEIKSMGDKVIINNVPSITINTYAVGTTLTYEVPAPSVVELQIDKAFYFGVNVSDVIEYQSKPELMSMFTGDAANQLKIAVDRDCFKNTLFDIPAADTPGLCVAANRGATAGAISGAFDLGTDLAPITLTGNNILQKITAMSAVLDEQNVPEEGRWLVITPYERNILMQSNLAQAQFMGDDKSMIRNGRIGMIDRFTVYVSNLLPTAAVNVDYNGDAHSGAALKRHAVVAGHKSALTFASQINKVENLPNPTDFGTLVRGLMVYGRKPVKTDAFTIMQVAG